MIIFLIFWEEFQSKLKDLLPNGKSLKGFQDYCLQIMIFYASLKTKYVRSNQVSFMHEELQRAIMIRSKLKNTFLKAELKVRKKIFELKILRKTKKQCYSNFEIGKVAVNKKFWKTVKNFFPISQTISEQLL